MVGDQLVYHSLIGDGEVLFLFFNVLSFVGSFTS